MTIGLGNLLDSRVWRETLNIVKSNRQTHHKPIDANNIHKTVYSEQTANKPNYYQTNYVRVQNYVL